ncbi:phosphatidylinositol alpha-mannosyltransferase [Bifidobacterium commune]|uniref:Phosphatidylinositol alpha-mannosyltransferase n=1 Tax=Bifidobacterium commune TaxID=1505727 RepID=A0A1C4H1R7_9BIFI|nr:glycosyltransferase family 4 protein [Bifidobacterium commune]MBB2954828.1 phosphatidylinositol alpha-mannosyltransferase [Bifidobacterium commune]SCC78869.1 phosphatidylinositol alpha-mannosyltransferase [Bifidobacterium commune]
MSNEQAYENRVQSDPLHGRKLNVGIISPYSFETPGGVQLHIRDFSNELMRRGHKVEVLAPGRRTKDMPSWVTTNDSSFSIPYNGSVARLSYFGFVGFRTRRWVKQGHFDIVHLHEPECPSLSHKPLMMIHHPPFVGTFHGAFDPYPLALRFTQGYLRKYLSPLSAGICVSDAAKQSVVHYAPRDIEYDVIPNGIDCNFFASAQTNRAWRGTSERPTIGFLGRMNESRKGFSIFVQAASQILQQYPGARFLCAGTGEKDAIKILDKVDGSGELARHFEFLGRISDADKARFYKSIDIYVAPQTGGESFGIVLVEAMAASCAVVSSDLEAFRAVTQSGKDAALFANGDVKDCAIKVLSLLNDSEYRERIRQASFTRSKQYDWPTVVDRVLEVYARALS